MAIVYNVQAGIVNEGNSEIERYAAKILRVTNNSMEDFIKTYPLITHKKNYSSLSLIQKENSSAYIGISFFSYSQINFIQFTSTLKCFPLNQGDQIIFYFGEDEVPMEFSFYYPKTPAGFASKNIHPLRETDLLRLSKENLSYWRIVNKATNDSIIGGFTYSEDNRQYKSQKIGQKLFRLMAQNIINVKKMLPRY